MKFSQLSRVGAVLALSGALALTACAGEGSASPDGASGENVTLATGVDPTYGAVYIADEKGFFADEGVNVEVLRAEGGPAMGQALTAGQAQMATLSNGTTVTLMANDPDLVALAVMQRHPTALKVVLREGINDAEDINKIAVAPGTLTLAAMKYLESEGIDPASVEFVQTPPPDVPTVLGRGEVDATVIFQPWADRALKESNGKIVATSADFGVPSDQWLIADGPWLDTHEDAAARIARALSKANAFIAENADEAFAIVGNVLKIEPEAVELIMNEATHENFDLDESTLAVGNEQTAFFVEQGNIAAAPKLEGRLRLGWWSQVKDGGAQ